MNRTSLSLSRHDLYEMVWSQPVIRLAGKYGVSDVWIHKICKKYNIPRPPRGYWAQIQSGKRIKRTPLPKVSDDGTIHINVYPSNGRPSTEKSNRPKSIYAPQLSKKIVVPENLTDAHPLIEKTAKILTSCKPNLSGIVVSHREDCLNIRVSREQIDRALRVMDTVIKKLHEMGLSVVNSENKTIVTISDVPLDISIEEELRRRRIRAAEHSLEGYYQFGYNLYDRYSTPTGKLSLVISNIGFFHGKIFRRIWRDTDSKRLEECLNSFISGLIKVAEIKKSKNLEQHNAE